jgi:hypothetical protein
VKKRLLTYAAGLFCVSASICTLRAIAQEQSGEWHLTGVDPGQSGWQKGELDLKPDNIAGQFKFLWKIKLGQPLKGPRNFSEPLLAGRLINGQGFKDIVYWSSADTLYAVDSELGNLLWKKHYDMKAAPPGCGVSSLSILMEPPVTINFRARRTRPPGTPRPAPETPTPTNERRLGVAPGGGYFGMKGIYVLTPDGMLHEQVITTGDDFAPPVKFLPAANGDASGLNFIDKTIYTATAHGCGEVPNGLWAIDLASPTYQVTSYNTQKVGLLGLAGPVLTPDGASIIVTGPGLSDSNAEIPAASVVLVAKNMKVEDWFTPEGGMATYESVSPVTFTLKDRQLVVAPGKNGAIALLDATSIGGTNHHTPLAETASLTRPGEKHGWDGFASWQDKDGSVWIFASISAGISIKDGDIKQNGSAPHGGIVAFKIDEAGGKLALVPVWVSKDMVNPAPPRVANGVVIALAGGDTATSARLQVLNAATGEELYTSGNEIPTYTQRSGVAVGDSHAFFTDHDNVLYSFGIGMEH